MVDVTHVKTHDSGVPHMDSITDLEAVQTGQGWVLYSASEADGGLTVFSLSENSSASVLDQISYNSSRGTLGVADITVTEINGQMVLLPAGRYDDRMAIHVLGDDGSFESVEVLNASPSLIGYLTEVEVVTVGNKSVVVAAQEDGSGFNSYRIRNDLSINYQQTYNDGPSANITAPTDIVSCTIGNRSFFFVSSAEDDGVTCYSVARRGNIKERGSINATEGLFVDAPTTMDTVAVNGTQFLLVGAGGSSSITTIEVDKRGRLTVTDHDIDDLNTRYGGVQDIETFVVDDRVFVVAGGADDGISIFELSSDGRLHFLTAVADTHGTSLEDVTAIEAVVIGNDVQLFVTGEEGGISQFTVDLGNLGVQRSGTDSADTLSGTGKDDLLVGEGGNDTLDGKGGHDRLIDGSGSDTMTGGSGADVFVLVDDNSTDTITDFEDGIDLIDVSDYPVVGSIADMTIQAKGYGLLITIGDDQLRLEDPTLSINDITDADFIF